MSFACRRQKRLLFGLDPRQIRSEVTVARLGSKTLPAIIRVQTLERAREVAALCSANRIHYIIGFEPEKPEDVTDLERALNAEKPMTAALKPGRNEPCPCGSGLKFKRCCAGG